MTPPPRSHLLDIITVTQPGVRHRCRLHTITNDAIVCGVGIGKKPITYQAEDVAAVLERHPDPTKTVSVIVLVAGAACLAGSFFTPVTAVAVLLRVLAGLSLPVVGAFGVGDNPESYQDSIYYLRSGYTLSGSPLTLSEPTVP
jgi:hypothetical protein